jgi:hypothetical protein
MANYQVDFYAHVQLDIEAEDAEQARLRGLEVYNHLDIPGAQAMRDVEVVDFDLYGEIEVDPEE